VYGIVPLGTGNDFARFYGWGGKNPRSSILKNDYAGVKQLVRQWCSATIQKHDVWQVHTTMDPATGSILKVNGQKEEPVTLEDGDGFSNVMINYFSVGQESQVGIQFDQNRTKSQTMNLAVYACCGLFQEIQCTKQQHIDDLIRSVHVGLRDQEECLVLSSEEDAEDVHGEAAPSLIGSPEVLMFLNINSFSGGKCKPWSRDLNEGVEPPPAAKDVDVDNNPGDGRLEVLTLPNIVHIPLDKIVHAARRVHSGG
jgi:diacylglycerol kinase (ATP)